MGRFPAYIAEMSPASIRGTLVSLKEAAIVLGICLGYGVGYAYSEKDGGWRWAYGWTVPASDRPLCGSPVAAALRTLARAEG